jgi:hypothetical protein
MRLTAVSRNGNLRVHFLAARAENRNRKEKSEFLSAFPQKVSVVIRVLFVRSTSVILHSQWSVILRRDQDSLGMVARRIVGNYPASFGEQTVDLEEAETCELFKRLNIAHSPPLPCGRYVGPHISQLRQSRSCVPGGGQVWYWVLV